MIFHVALDGTMEGALGLGVDVIDTAARLLGAQTKLPARLLAQRVVSHDGRAITSSSGRTITVDGALSLRAIRAGDVLVVPGILATDEPSLERVLSRADVQHVVSLLSRAAAKGARIAASCSATFLLAAAGLLDGRAATTTWWLMPCFVRRFPAVELSADRMVVDAREVITAGSAFAHADLMLALVARLTSPALASSVAKYLVLDSRDSHSRYMIMDHLRSFDPMLRTLERFVMANLARRLSLEELAHAVAMSPRTLARRVHASVGMTPLEFVRRLRVARAAQLLDTTHDSVEDVAARVGYADAAAFRRVFRKHAGQAPRGR